MYEIKKAYRTNSLKLPLKILVISFIILMTIEPIMEQNVVEGSIFRLLYHCMVLLAMIFPFLLFIFINPKITPFRMYYLLVFAYCMLLTGIYQVLGENQYLGLISIYMVMLTAYFYSKINLIVVYRIQKYIAIIGIFLPIVVFTTQSIDLRIALLRGYTWTGIFYWSIIYWAMPSFVLISFILKRNQLLGLAFWISAVIFNMIFIKRIILADSIFLVLMLIIMANRNKKISKKKVIKYLVTASILLIMIFAVAGDMLSSLFNEVIARFGADSLLNSIRSFERFVESYNYFKSIHWLEFILGKGFLSTHEGLGHINFALHSGWGNLILKGGLLLFSISLIPLIKAVGLFFKGDKIPPEQQIAAAIIIFYSIRFIYSNIHSLAPEGLVYYHSILVAMDYREGRNHEIIY